MHEYAVNNKIIDKEKKFIVMNCSEYANNPELLTANLFGHVKGAYTGANTDNPGLVQLADGGVLFLDEVHCLPAECQEKLFLYMDKGEYHRLGDNENWYKSSCRLVFATTQKPEDALLKTLLRRIPITIQIPSLLERGREEKQAMLASIFKKESSKINRNIEISYLAYQVLMDSDIPGNVGGLINCAKAACAKSFLNIKEDDESLKIYSYDLPSYVLNMAPSINFKLQDSNDIRMMNFSYPIQSNTYDSKLIILYKSMLKEYRKYLENPLTNNIFTDELLNVIEIYSEDLIFKKGNNVNINNDFTSKITDKIFSIIINKYSIKVSNNDILLISRYIADYTKHYYDVNNWIVENYKEVKGLMEVLQLKYPLEILIASEIIESINLNLDIKLDDMMKVRLMAMIIDFKNENNHENIVSVILCHGYSTASSLASAVNKMVGKRIFDAIDMQLDVSLEKITIQLNDFLKTKRYFNKLLLMVDMGSLEEIYKGIKVSENVSIAIINNVNTKLALELGMSIKNGFDLEETLNNLQSRNIYQYKYINNTQKKKVILSVCATGIGSADKIMSLFKDSLPDKTDVEILTYDFERLVENGIKDPIFEKYDVSFIIGTMNPDIESIPYIAIEDLVLDNDLDELCDLMKDFIEPEFISVFRSKIIKNFTLNNIVNHLTILNANKVLEDVEEVVNQMELGLKQEISTPSKIGLYMHLACLIERLILKNEIKLENSSIDNFIKGNKEFVDIVKDSFSVVKYAYSVEIPDSEIMLIYNYFKNN